MKDVFWIKVQQFCGKQRSEEWEWTNFPAFCFWTVARTCSLIFIVLDVLKPLGHKRLIEYELEGFGIR